MNPTRMFVAAAAALALGVSVSHGFNAGTVFGVTYHGTDVTLNVLSVGAVPEPNTCLMMLAGFGVIGGVIRRRLSS